MTYHNIMTTPLKVGDRVRPANDGEDQSGDILHWTRLKGTVRAIWIDCGEERAEVRWDRRAPYPVNLPTYLLSRLP